MTFAAWGTPWTDNRIKTLRRLWIRGVPAAEIAKKIGVTHSAVLNKAGRLKLPRRPG